jgi:hypothetical protein
MLDVFLVTVGMTALLPQTGCLTPKLDFIGDF